MRTLWTSRHFSSATPPAGEPSDEVVIEDANKSTGTPSFFFLGLFVACGLLLFWLVTPPVEPRMPLNAYAPEPDRLVDYERVVDAEKGTHWTPVGELMAAVAGKAELLAPIPPDGGFKEFDLSTAEGRGEKAFGGKGLGCNVCHSVDGTRVTGPPLNGLFGRERKLTNGTQLTIDEAYVTRSIKDPFAEVVAVPDGEKPYPPEGMTLDKEPTDEDIADLVAYLKTLQ